MEHVKNVVIKRRSVISRAVLLGLLTGTPIIAEPQSAVPVDSTAGQGYGQQSLLDTIEGIPINRIEIANHSHEQAATANVADIRVLAQHRTQTCQN